MKRRPVVFLWLAILGACSSDKPPQNSTYPLSVFAAASLTSVMAQLGEAFQIKHPEIQIEFNFGASSMLAKQINLGAEADIYISANSEWVDFLDQRGQIINITRNEFLSNRLVLIAPLKNENKITSLHDFEKSMVKRIALADWAHVPAGIYAKQALENFGIWENVRFKCIPALDVRAALSYVERGDVDCGIVYRTDARISKKVIIVEELPEESQPKIRYSMVVTRRSNHPQGQSFLAFMRSQKAKDIFQQNGFDVLTDE